MSIEIVSLWSTKMDQVTLRRNDDSEIQLKETGIVALYISYTSIHGIGGHTADFTGKIFRRSDVLVMKMSGICLGVL